MSLKLRSYRIDEASFSIDSSFADDSITILTGHSPDFEDTSFVITRARPDTTDLTAYATEQLKQLQSTCPEYQLITTRDIAVTGIKCKNVVFSWRADRGVLYQWQLYIPLDATMLTATFTVLNQVTDNHKKAIAEFLSSLKLG
jgi:hypothetical protein